MAENDSISTITEGRVEESDSFDAFYYSVAFETIASLAARCLNEPGISSHDMLWSIQKMAECFAAKLGENHG